MTLTLYKGTTHQWPHLRLKHLCRFVGGGTPDKAEMRYWGGKIPWVSPKDMKTSIVCDSEEHITVEGLENSAAKIVESGAILVVVRSGILRHSIPVAINAVAVTLNQDMLAILPDAGFDPRYLARFIEGHQAELLRAWSKEGTTVESLERPLMGETAIPAPRLSQQRAIADYLDREVERIDDLMAAKERVLGLLSEKRQALITRAITRGIDPNVSYRDSGIPWLGGIPAHWEVERARWLFNERDERSSTGNEELLTVSHLTGVTPRSEKQVNMFEAETTEGYKICLEGDLVINTLWAWMGAMGVAPLNGIVSPSYHVYKLATQRLYPGYVDELVRLNLFAQEVTRYSKGVWSSRLRLYPEGLFEVSLPVPPRLEQRKIFSFLQKEQRRLVDLKAATERAIELLRERRAAVIAAAVTGRIDADRAA